MKKKLSLAVDLDGTLTILDKKGRGGWNEKDCLNAKPNLKNIKAVNDAFYKGHFIIIYTCRRWSNRNATRFWLEKYGVRYNDLNMSEKLHADIYLDDRAINAKDINIFIKATS